MANASGSQVKAAVKLAATWGTPVACGAGDGIMILPSTVKRERKSIVDNSLGNYWPVDVDPTEVVAGGSLEAFLRYRSFDLLMALFMGGHAISYTTPFDTGTATGGSATTVVDSGASWTPDALIGRYVTITAGAHNAGKTRKITDNDATTLTFATMGADCEAADTYEIGGSICSHAHTLVEDLSGLFATLAFYNGAYVNEFTTFKAAGFTIKGQSGQAISCSFDILAHNRDAASTTNTSTTMTTTVTWPEISNRIFYRHMAFRMNVASDGALDSGDLIYPESFTLAGKRPLSGQYGAGGSFDYISEPEIDGPPEVTLDMNYSRVSDGARPAALDAGTEYKLDMTATGALISGASYRSMLFEFPRLKYSEVQEPMSEKLFQQPVKMLALKASSAPAGMSGLTLPFRMTNTNDYCGNPIQQGN